MVYLQLRFTGSHYDDPSHNWTNHRLLKQFRKKYDVTQYIYVEEKFDKFGKETTPHIHFNCIVAEEVKKDTLQRWLRRTAETAGKPLKGNKCYSLRLIGDPDDEDRWWRYCCKEKGAKVTFRGFEKSKIVHYKIMAQDEREQQIKRNLQAQDNYLDKSSFKGKMFDFLKKEGVDSHRPFIIGLIKYYLEKGKVAPFSKLEDYWIDYQISIGIMTPEQYYDRTYL